MLQNYFKTALRNLMREKGITLVNLSGLALGIACSIVLFLMVSFMSSFDTFQVNRDRIYRIVTQSQRNTNTDYQPGVPTVLADAFRLDFPEAEAVVFTAYRYNSLVSIPQRNGELKKFQEENGVVFTEPSFFKIFDRKLIEGDAAKGLDEPNEAIISVALAKKFFGKEDVVGEFLKYQNHEYRITAVMEDAPSNTDFPFSLMLSYATVKKEYEGQGWQSISSSDQCYVLLKKGEDIAKIEARLPAFTKKYMGEDNTDETEFIPQALTEMHFDERFDTYSESTVSRNALTAFSVIGLILVVTACINFVNLSTAEAIKRSKEVGIRKSLGSTRAQLVWQFLGETTLVTLLAVIISLGITQIALSFLNPFMDFNLSIDLFQNSSLWIYLACITVFVSLLSGLYPAFIVSGYKPALALKNLISNKNTSGYTLRRVLVIAQFCISQLFIIGTIVIIQQMNYSQQKNLGFVKDAIIIVPIPEREEPTAEASKMRTLRNEMMHVSGVTAASLNSAAPSSGQVSMTDAAIEGVDKDLTTQVKQVDGNYVDLFKLDLIAGQNIADLDTTTGYIVNEKLVHTAGFSNPAEVIGRNITIHSKKYPVVGVVKDFHTVSLREQIDATAMFNRIRNYRALALKIDLNRSQDVIAVLKQKWEATYPEGLFEYEFLDENIREFYDGERKMSTLLTIFTSMAIFIGCLGLFGLATFMANQKNKEIGVRKVLGASVESIVMMFSGEYLKLILIGFALAAPLAWWIMGQFLNEFAYKIDIGPGIFIITISITLFIAFVTVGYRSLRAAMQNPVKSLRSE